MQVVHAGDAPFEPRRHPRNARFEVKPLLEGRAGTPGNFMLVLSNTYDDFQSPRHRHNFEQFRFQISGVCGFGRDGDMTPGTAGYFPEGVFYGPQANTGDCTALVLQFGGLSGSGYMSEDELQASLAELTRVGDIQVGVFRRREGEGRKQQDAYEAAWENHTGRKLSYPPANYPAPVMMHADKAGWTPLEGAAGVSVKPLGRFPASGTAVSLLAVEEGAVHRLGGPVLVFVISGDGTLAGEAARAQSCAEAAPGERLEIGSASRMELLVIELPVCAANANHAIRHEVSVPG